MPVNVGNAKIGGRKINKEKLEAGKYICEVENIRTKETRGNGDAFFLDFTVEKCITEDGSAPMTKGSYAVFPDDARGSAKLTKAEAKQLEEGKIIIAVAAVLGKSRDEAEFVTQEVFDKALATQKRPVSPLKGRKFVLEAVSYVAKTSGKQTVYYELYPMSVLDEVSEDDAEPAVKEEPKAKQPPKAAKKAVFPPAPWQEAGKDEDGDVYYWNTESDETLYEADLRARLAA